jgi:hypothetical protein
MFAALVCTLGTCSGHSAQYCFYSGRKIFTGALTNGLFWLFIVVIDGPQGLQLYETEELSMATKGGLIIELLKDMVCRSISRCRLRLTVSQILYDISPMFTGDIVTAAQAA